MAYSTPLTAVSSTALTAAQWNASVRDDMLVTPAALATTAGRIFVATGTNAIAERAIETATVATSQTTGSTTFTNLATVGPAITMTTGARAIIFITASMTNDTAGVFAVASCSVTGASTIPAVADTESLMFQMSTGSGGTGNVRASDCIMYTTLTPGSNTFTMVYRASGGTATFKDRKITGIAL